MEYDFCFEVEFFYWVFALKRKFSLSSKKKSHFVDIPAWLKLLLQHSKWLPPKYLSWPCFVHRHPKARDFKLISSKKDFTNYCKFANTVYSQFFNYFTLLWSAPCFYFILSFIGPKFCVISHCVVGRVGLLWQSRN